MATHDPITGAPTRAPSIDRRSLLGGLALAPFAASPVITAMPGRRWDAVRAHYEAAVGAAGYYHEAEYLPASQALDRITGACPSLEFTMTTKGGRETRVEVSPHQDYGGYSLFARHRTIQGAYRAWLARYQAAERDARWQAVSSRMEALWHVEDEAREALMAEPAPDAAAAMFKVGLALANDELWENEREFILADTRRLGGAH